MILQLMYVLYVKLYPIERNDVLYILYTLEMRIAQPKRST